MKLSPRQIGALAGAVCGGEGTPIDYRTAERIGRFRAFVGVDVDWEPGSSRWKDAVAYLEVCNETTQGRGGLPAGIEKVVVALVDRREFDSDRAQDDAVEFVQEIVAGVPVEIELDARRKVAIRSTQSSAGQQVIEREIHTVFEEVLKDGELQAARDHYKKARRLLSAAEPDLENAAKEAVCCIESLAAALTGERDLSRAIAKAVRADLIPSPLGEMIKKLYAYRGDEPGVAHGHRNEPDVDVHDAYFLVNEAAVIGLYLRAKLAADEGAA